MEIHCPYLPLIIHLRNGRFSYCLAYCHLLIAQLILGITTLEINEMEIIIVATCHYGTTLR